MYMFVRTCSFAFFLMFLEDRYMACVVLIKFQVLFLAHCELFEQDDSLGSFDEDIFPDSLSSENTFGNLDIISCWDR